MNVDELKDVMLEGFRRIDARFDAVDQQFVEMDRKFTARFLKVEDRVEQVGMKFEEVIDLLKYVKDGESPQLAQRVSALELRVNTLEKKKR